MTISTQQSSQTFLGNGVTNTFDFAFVGDSAANIIVQYTNASGTITTLSAAQYTLFLNPASTGALWGIGGTVTYPTVGSPISNGTSLTISRILPLTQETSISNQGAFAPSAVETAIDTLEMQVQQVSARSGLFRGTWSTNVLYNFGDYVIDGANGANTGNYYSCVIANTSGTWATDLTAGDWSLVINVQAIDASAATAVAAASTATAQAVISTTQATNSANSATASATSATSSAASATSSANSAISAAASAVTAASFGSTLKGTSTTSNAIGIGTKTFTTQSGLTFVAGGFVVIVSQASATNYMHGQVTSYSGTTLVVNVTDVGGSGTLAAWNIILSGTQGPAGIVNVNAFGATGNGVTDDTAAFTAALATGNSVFVPLGTYLISSTLTVNAQNLIGAGREIAVIITTSAIDMIHVSSNATVSGLKVDGQNFATRGITAINGGTNKCTITNNRVQRCTYGISLLDAQNSTLIDNSSYWCDYCYYIDGAENCKWYNNNATLLDSSRTVIAGARCLLVTNALYGTCRDLSLWGGILERGVLVNDYCAEITGAQIDVNGVEFNGGGVCLIKINTGCTAKFRSCNYALSSTNYIIDCNSGSSYDSTDHYISGSRCNGITTPFISYFDALCIGGNKLDTVILDQRFDVANQGWTASSGGAISYNATDRCLDVTTAGTNQGTNCVYIGAAAPFDANYTVGRIYKIECYISSISTATPLSLNLLTGPFATPSGSRNLSTTITNGINTIYAASAAGDAGGFSLRANEAGAKTWKINYFKFTLI